MRKIYSLLFWLFLCIPVLLSGQNFKVEGKVVDSRSNEPLAFVNIIINNGKYGGTTDIDGIFKIASYEPVRVLHLSYVGYEKQSYAVTNASKKHSIKLFPKSFLLNEVTIVAGENPAHRIIRHVINLMKQSFSVVVSGCFSL